MHLTQEQVARLDNLSVPSLNFPATFVAFATMFSHGGTTVNGEPSMPWPGAPKSDAERY